ncbi:MAG: nitrate- and nitrite sensing domain-containing protein [Magnetococcales bacterium]|nr:nitrate- and nitrite sensing domain-containing protein [Magnetococcales bacterium]
MEKLPIKKKFTLILVVPLAALLWFGSTLLGDKWRIQQSAEIMLQLAGMATSLSDLVHELQKERGLTAGFVGSEGKQFRDEMTGQREKVNQRLTSVSGLSESLAANPELTALSRKIAESLRPLYDIKTLRGHVDALDPQAKEAVPFITRVNAALLGEVRGIALQAVNAHMASLTNAYVNFLLAKEKSGLERAILNRTFAKNQFAPGDYSAFIGMVAEQQAHNRLFESLASEELRQAFQEQRKRPAFAEVEQMRAVAMDKGVAGNFGIAPTLWFETITTKINQLKELEDRIAAAITRDAEELSNRARRESVALWIGSADGAAGDAGDDHPVRAHHSGSVGRRAVGSDGHHRSGGTG